MKKFKALLLLNCLAWTCLSWNGEPGLAKERDYLCLWQGDLNLYRYYHWFDYEMPIQVYIAPVDPKLKVQDPSLYPRAVKAAANAWSQSFSKIKFEFVSEKKHAQMVIQWRDTFPAESSTWGQALLPQPYQVSGKIYHRTEVVLAVRAQAHTTISGEAALFGYDELLAVATHEMGHGLGLLHDPKNRENLMYPGYMQFAADRPPRISAEDLATLKRLYSFGEDLKKDPCS